MTAESNLDGAGGTFGLFPADRAWEPDAGFQIERPPSQWDDPVARTLANLAAKRAQSETNEADATQA